MGVIIHNRIEHDKLRYISETSSVFITVCRIIWHEVNADVTIGSSLLNEVKDVRMQYCNVIST